MTSINDPVSGQDRTLPGILVGSTVVVSLATLTVVGRFVSRFVKKAPLAIDDAFIVAALIFTLTIYAFFLVCRGYGLGKHREVAGEGAVAAILKVLYFLQIVYVVTPATIKLSLLLMYRRIFVKPKFTRLTNIMIGVIALWTVIEVIMSIFNCTPISAFWTGQGKCLDFRDFAIGYAVINIVTDLVVWAMPIPQIWKLQLPRLQKVALVLIFALGLFSCAASLARLLTSVLALDKWDVTWDFAPSFLWSITEPSVGIICTCLPTMRALFNSMFRGAFRGVYGSSRRYGTATSHLTKRSRYRSGTYDDVERPSVPQSRKTNRSRVESRQADVEAEAGTEAGTERESDDYQYETTEVSPHRIHVQQEITVEQVDSAQSGTEPVELTFLK